MRLYFGWVGGALGTFVGLLHVQHSSLAFLVLSVFSV